ncbi:MAG: TetR/AcrR family transcriptional regulator [Proteobacteria bacterium]|nr:TetR/AcrR family transcriptional regulator [Pseudomonadota bacterium]
MARPVRPAHRRDATATRAAILASAVRAFSAQGYDGAGVREIAAGAGVTAMLVNRYFGSKEKLFAEAVAATMERPIILSDANLGAADRPRAMAKALVAITTPGETPLDGLQILLKSAASKAAARIARVEIDKRNQKRLSSALDGAHASERAAIVFALVAGLQFMRQSLELPALKSVSPKILAELLAPLFAQLLDGDQR